MTIEEARVGQMVRMTRAAIEQGLQGRVNRRTGMINGFTRDKERIRVRVEGLKMTESWAPKFWEEA